MEASYHVLGPKYCDSNLFRGGGRAFQYKCEFISVLVISAQTRYNTP